MPPSASVILVAFHFPPSAAAGAARPGRFFKHLPRFGWDPLVVTNTPQTETDERIRVVPAAGPPDRRTLRGWQELLLRRFVLIRHEAVLWPGAASEAIAQFLRERPSAAVLSSSPPLAAHQAAHRIKRRFGVDWIADFRDPLAGNPTRPQDARTRLVDRFLERRIFRAADALIANTDAMLAAWRERSPEHAGKMRLLWNGYDPDHAVAAQPTPGERPRLLIHAGMVYARRHPLQALASIRRLLLSGRLDPQDLSIRLVGTIAPAIREALVEYDDLRQAGILEIQGPTTPDDALEQTARAHGLLLLDVQGEGGGLQAPSKMFDYVRIGRPILACTNRDSPVDRILGRCGAPTVRIYTDDPGEVVDGKLLEFLELPPEPSPPSEWFRDTFDGVRQAEELARLLDELRSRRR